MSPAHTHRDRRQAPQPTATRVNLGPLTTAFVAPSHCSRAALACPTCDAAIRGQSCHVNGPTATAEDDTGCWPRATEYPKGGQAPLLGMGFYSPGLLCPTGWSSACTAVSQTQGQVTSAPKVTGQFQFPLEAGETAVGCCPQGYSCALNGGMQTCHQVVTSTYFDALTCNGVTEGDLNSFAVPFTVQVGVQTISQMDLWAPMIQLNHKATDLPETETEIAVADESTSSVPASSQGLMTMSVGYSTTPAATSATPTASRLIEKIGSQRLTEPDSRLPLATKIGIAFAPIAFAAVVLGIILYLWVKRRYLYPEHHFIPPKGQSSDASESGSREFQPEPTVGGTPEMQNMPAFPPPVAYEAPDPNFANAHNPHDFAANVGNSPGPVVVAWGKEDEAEHYQSNQYQPDHYRPDSYQPDHYPAPDAQATHLGHNLGGDGLRDLESPIDGTSPFRLKRGNTLKKNHETLTADRETAKPISPLAALAARAESTGSNHSSQDRIEWEYPLKRENSFSRPRPRPRTGVSSVYIDDGRSSVASWNNAMAGEAVDRMPSMKRAKSFSRPRPRRDTSEDTLVESNWRVGREEGAAF